MQLLTLLSASWSAGAQGENMASWSHGECPGWSLGRVFGLKFPQCWHKKAAGTPHWEFNVFVAYGELQKLNITRTLKITSLAVWSMCRCSSRGVFCKPVRLLLPRPCVFRAVGFSALSLAWWHTESLVVSCARSFPGCNHRQILHTEGNCCAKVLLQGKDSKKLSTRIRNAGQFRH